MREFKFRAWVKSGTYPHKMWWFDVRWGNYYQGNGWIGMLPIGETNKDNRFQIDPDDVELMQYTGLKDKNGKEIYDKDIIQSQTNIMKGHKGSVIKASNGAWKVFYKRGSHPLYKPDGHEDDKLTVDLLDWTSENRAVIIGNIYENQELLNS